MPNIMAKLELEPHLKLLELSSIQDHQTCGYLQKNANYHQLAISINISIAQRVQPIKQMDKNSTLPMVQVQLWDSLEKMLPLSLGLELKILSLVKLLNFKVFFNIFLGISFLASKFDGILGMAWPAISVDNLPLIFDLLYKQGRVEGNSFSFYLTKKAG